MSEYFIPTETCPKSKKLLFYSKIKTVRCGFCGFLNPNFVETLIKLPSHPRVKYHVLDQEVIEIVKLPAESFTLPLSWHYGKAIQVFTVPDLRLGHAENARQTANKYIANKKIKTGFTPFALVIHFNVGVAQFIHDNSIKDEGEWKAMLSFLSIDEDNRALTFG